MYPLSADDAFFQRLRLLDHDLFLAVKSKPCPRCGGPLDTAHYPRKPRGLGECELKRFSLCCRREGCRHRVTPPSLRFFGRKVYPAWVVILAGDFCRQLGLSRPIARQTLVRWRRFWREWLSESHAFMRRARAWLPPGHPPCNRPAGVLDAFAFPDRDSWIRVLTFFRDAAF